MGKWGMRTATVAAALVIVGMMAPAASATEATAPTGYVPCEAIFGDYICQQMSDTGQFVTDTVNRLGPAVQEWRGRIVVLANYAWDTAMCYVSGACPITIAIQP